MRNVLLRYGYWMILGVLSCEPPPSGPIFTGSPPPPYQAPLELMCIRYAGQQHPHSLLLEAAQQNTLSTHFPALLEHIRPRHPLIYRALTSDKHERYTLFMPTDKAWEAFRQQYPAFPLKGDSLQALIAQHIALDFIPYQLLEDGLPRASAANGRIINFSTDDNGCILLNGYVHLEVIEDLCKNGVIHLIDQVLVPENLR